ncbi:hypothetical protein P3W85_29830 [Cupriavidus basilensis]|uniref:Uncharacterized protein n=1 Tax=Cupriavidus basilensis TaxID=68895 RepID=A0ABT6AX15_9BURK|nr:hypothetical protein [Cupriavidus basilensis]MDF3837123.1 hypothetical protein [Cupriavidus basilensis]
MDAVSTLQKQVTLMQSVIHLLVVTHPDPGNLKALLRSLKRGFDQQEGTDLDELWPELADDFNLGD